VQRSPELLELASRLRLILPVIGVSLDSEIERVESILETYV
jgi:hypothetical protein